VNLAERIRPFADTRRAVVRCLGRFRLHDGSGNQLQVRTRKARALVAALAVSNRPMSRDTLAALLWSDRGEQQARASLRQTIFELQHCGGQEPVLAVGRDDVSIRGDLLVTDVELIRDAASDDDWQRLLDHLREARPGLLTDLDGLDEEFDSWLRTERSQEPTGTLAIAVEAAERCMESAGPRAALEIACEVLRLDPADEPAARLAMRIDKQVGDNAALHRRYSVLRDRLRDEYDAEPSPETVDLFAKLANGNGAGTSSPFRFAPQPDSSSERTSAEQTVQKRSWVVTAALGVLALVILGALAAVLLLSRYGGRPVQSGDKVLVAVLPFEQQPPDNSFLAAGLWEQTRGALTRNPSIRVLGRSTTEAMASAELPPDGYRKRFGVTHLLEGTVRRAGSGLLVSVSLTRTSDGVAVWQDSFRGRMGEPFALQDAIANGIEGKLRAQLAPGGGRRAEQIATSPEVYALYSEAKQLVAERDLESFQRAEALLRQALKADPNYAPAWSLLGEAIYFSRRRAIEDSSARAEALAAVRHALSLAPNFGSAHATLALVQGEVSQEAEARLRRAVALDPSDSEAWNWLGNSLVSQGRTEEAIAAYGQAIAIDPLFYPAATNLFDAADEIQDQAMIDKLLQTITNAGADPDFLTALKVGEAYSRGDLSGGLALLARSGLDENGRSKKLLWGGWFDGLTAIGYTDAMHRVTGCPDWYAPLLAGKVLPPTTFENKPVAPLEFWTSMYFSAPASRVMVQRGRSAELVRLYRAGFQSPDDFISRTGRMDLLPDLAPNLAIALETTGSPEEASYLLSATSRRLEMALRHTPARADSAKLALVRAAQGERAQALALLDTALRRGWFPDGRTVALDLAQEPAFHALRGDPRFEAARKRILDHIARERAELGPIDV
jgi:DNA-binding SARP family transcriptional activator/TolB-like protein